ncbi:MAG: hypothetical protein ACOC4C_03500 [Fibrobacterota bacterium]
MNRHVYVHSFAEISQRGIISPTKKLSWDADQQDVFSIKREQVLEKPFPVFGKLQPPEKLSFSLAALMLSGDNTQHDENTGICLASTFGSFSTDCKYMETVSSGFASPAYFSATLPSSPVAEVAISFKLKGPDRVIAGGNNPGIDALDLGINALLCGKTSRMMILIVNAIDPKDIWSLSSYDKKRSLPCGFGLLLGSHTPDSAPVATLRLEGTFMKTDSDIPPGETYFTEIISALYSNRSETISIRTPDYSGNAFVTKEMK